MIVIYSKEDLAGANIASHLKKIGGVEVNEVVSPLLHCEKEISDVNTDYIIFVSRHKSEAELPCFTVHTPGNWSTAEMGGKPKQLCSAAPSAMKTILMNIDRHAESNKLKKIGWKVCMECTHHGPSIELPCFFVEIGSDEKEWKNELAGKIVADAIVAHTWKPYRWPIAFGIGGTHYCPKFTKYELAGAAEENPFAFAHVLPNYQVDAVDFETFKQGVERSNEMVSTILIDWKGLKREHRDKILKFVERSKFPWQRI